MAIKKQEFYEGAALHLLARSGLGACIRYNAPFFVLDDRVWVYLKYSTKGRSPWSFSFASSEVTRLKIQRSESETMIGLICGADGVVTVSYEEFSTIVTSTNKNFCIACYRRHGEHYGVSGPDGTLEGKVAPSRWSRILER